jgi:hypothetical protein
VRLPEGLRARLDAYAEHKGLSVERAITVLIDAGLRAYERAVGAGKARAASRTPEEQSAARKAGWERIKRACEGWGQGTGPSSSVGNRRKLAERGGTGTTSGTRERKAKR